VNADLSPEKAAAHAAEHWSKVTTTGSVRGRWWQVPAVVRHINERVCGEPLNGLSAGARQWVVDTIPGLPLDRGIAIGGGNGVKEMELITAGIVRSVEVFEVAPARVAQGKDVATERGLADRVTFHERLLDPGEDIGRYDLVHWNNALHHMLDVDEWLAWSRRVLNPGGVLLLDDFVGATRFQWPRRQLDYASSFRRTLPDALLVDHRYPDRLLPREIVRPTITQMLASDPTEAADSGRILASLQRHFPEAEVRETGGVMYHLALSDSVANFESGVHDALLEVALLLDDALSDLGETHYAVALARLPDAAHRKARDLDRPPEPNPGVEQGARVLGQRTRARGLRLWRRARQRVLGIVTTIRSRN
jgi:SAM-dependent methyltransferase